MFAHLPSNDVILTLLIFVIVGPIVAFTVGREIFLWFRDRDRSPFNGFTLTVFVICVVAAVIILPWLTHTLLN